MNLTNKILKESYQSYAAGILPICIKTNRILVGLRSQSIKEGGTWANFGGMIAAEDNSFKEIAIRELQEETGYHGSIKLIPAYVYKGKSLTYKNYLGLVEEEFVPQLNFETDIAEWITLEELVSLSPKHYGLTYLLANNYNLIKKYCNQILIESNSSLNASRFKEMVSKYLKSEYSEIEIVKRREGREIVLLTLDLGDYGNFKKILQVVNLIGWYPTLIRGFETEYKRYSNKLIKTLFLISDFVNIGFEKKYDQKVSVPKIIYHSCPIERLEKIKKIGLTPKSKSKLAYHPDRIYFSDSKKELYWLTSLLFDKGEDKEHISGNYVILEIDTDKLKNIEFYLDPNFEWGVYTLSNIPPSAIKELERINVKDTVLV